MSPLAIIAVTFGAWAAVAASWLACLVWRDRDPIADYGDAPADDLMAVADAMQEAWSGRDDVMYRLACRHGSTQ